MEGEKEVFSGLKNGVFRREEGASCRERNPSKCREVMDRSTKKVYGNGLYVISSPYLCGMKIRIRYDFHAEASKIPPPISLIYS